MERRLLLLFVLAVAMCCTVWAAEPDVSASLRPGPEPTIFYMGSWTAEHADISPPLRDIPASPRRGKKASNDDPSPTTPCGPIDGFDPVAQTAMGRGLAGEAPSAMPAPNVSFMAFANDCGGCAPPDPNGDVGLNQVVVMANSTIAVYSKVGATLLTPRDINTLWAGFGGACEAENAGDPVVLYDQFADRWLISQFTAAGPTYYNCVALSTSADATGTWQRYAVSNGTSFPDYPKYGIWRDGYYFSTRNTSGSTGQGAYAMNRDQMLAGSLAPTIVNFLLPSSPNSYYGGDGLLPADVDGNTLPPVGTPQLFFGSMDNGGPYGAPQDAINIFEFQVDWATPANSTFTRTATIPVAAFDSTFTPCGGGRSCIPQSGTTNKLDILSYRQRLTFRAAYRNFGTHQSVVLTQSVSGFNSGTANAIAGMRWYELRDPAGAPTIYQQGTYVPGATDSVHRWMGSVAMDRVGNMGLAYSASSSTMFPSIRYTGRLAADPLGTMDQVEGSIVEGLGAQTGGGNRWGDYTSLNVDPEDDCTFWHFNEYYTATSAATWRMRVGSFTFPSCLCAATPAAPVASATAPIANRIAVSWNDSATTTITQYFVYRSTVSGGPYAQIATVPDSSPGVGNGAPYTYNDNTVSGGITYYYVVKSNDGISCTSPYSNQASATATGACTLPPTFAGLASVTNSALATCTLALNWTAGTPVCSGPVAYNVYRSTTAGFTPAPANLIAAAVSGTSYTDSVGLVYGTTYYYVARALDSSNGAEESNTVERSGTPTGAYTPGTWSDDAGDTGAAKMILSAPWAVAATGGRTAPKVYATGTYAASACIEMKTPVIQLGTGATLSFASKYDIETNWDAGILEVATAPTFTNWVKLPVTTYPNTLNNAGNACGIATGGAGTAFSLTNATPTFPASAYTASLSTYNGQQIQIRWRLGADGSIQGAGWWVDDISITNVQVPSACATGASCTPPGAPNLTSATAACTGTALNWNAGTGTTLAYNVYRATVSGGPYTKIAGPQAGTTYTDTTGTPGTTYYYVVRGACDAPGSNESANSNQRSVVALGNPTPTISGPGANTCPTATVALTTEAGMSGYQWLLGGSPIGGATTNTYVASASGSYTVRYTNAGGCTGTSAAKAVTITPCLPNIVYSANGPYTQVAGMGNNDAVLDPGESWDVVVTLTNTGNANATGVQASLTATGATFCIGTASYGAIAVGATANGTFRFTVGSSFTCGNSLSVNVVNKTSAQGSYTDENGAFTKMVGTVGGTTTYTSTDVPKTISDLTTVTSTVAVANTGILSDVNVTFTGITHTGTGDLDIFIQHPDGTLVELTTDNGGNGNDFTGTVFDDEAATAITAGANPYTGSFRPEGLLSALDGKSANGTWTLRVTDDANGDTGSLTGWSVTLTTTPVCNTWAGSNCNCAAPGAPSITGITDVSACAADGIQVAYTPGDTATSHDLYKDGVSVVTNYVSGAAYVPGDTASHTYIVRAVSGCGSTPSGGSAFADANGSPGAPAITGITDPDACTAGVQVAYTGGAGALSHDLYKDGVLAATGYSSGATYLPGDTLSHNYTVRAVSGSCTTTSGPQARADVANAPSRVGDTLMVTKSGTDITVSWTLLAGAERHEVMESTTTPATASFTSSFGETTGLVDGITKTMPAGSLIFYLVRAEIGTCNGPLN